MAKSNKQYRDIDLSLNINPLTKDFPSKIDARAIIGALKNLILYKPFDFKFHPEISSQIRTLLFENFTPAVKISIERLLINLIDNFEPRIELIELDVSDFPDLNAIQVSLTFRIVNTLEPISSKFYVHRLR